MKKLFLTLVLAAFAAISFAQNVPSYVPTNGLVGWWPFNGNANDESGNGNNGTVNGATLTTDRFGMTGKAYSFDGISNNINLNNVSSLTNAVSIGYWINIPNNGGGMAVVQGNPSPPYNTTFALSNKNLIQSLLYSNTCNSANPNLLDTTNNNSNQWVHFVYTIDANSDGKIYLNGVLRKTINGSGFTNCLQSGTNLRFGGKWLNNDPQWYNGKLDDIGIWNRALTQQEITDLYNGNICYQNITVTDTLLINTGITGFNPITYENTLRVWPNPTNDHITIDAGNLNVMNGYSIRITNSLGQQMFQSAINQQQFYLDLSTWTGNGMYFLNLIDPSGNIIDIKKIVLQ
jgi:hypothetical protein